MSINTTIRPGRAPVTPDGQLGPVRRHPGFGDPAYVRRRNAFVALADGLEVGEPSPPVTYTEQEHLTWRRAHATLLEVHRDAVCRAVLRARDAAPIPADHVPQHAEVGDRLDELTGFRFTPAGGPVPVRRFLGSMARGYFHAVQYVRHPAMPLYTPEPDVLHDVFGHGTHLASQAFAGLYRRFGAAAARVADEDSLDLLSRVYWFSLEYGVAIEDDEVKAYGAALLSSYGELRHLRHADIRPWDLAAVAGQAYQAAGYQPVLYAVRSLDHLAAELRAFLDDFDGTTRARLGLPALAERGPTT
ncbi:phenylalanine 4-monooxygenase [Saccharothrix sp. BKS2]|uniref:phenylalanine 4-monooxygenase n=1 Tax=Saccharothrix sp. BKS2 TaxID=3064400 RepID=UPI0039E85127